MAFPCPHGENSQLKVVKSNETVHNGMRLLYQCPYDQRNFSPIDGTPLATLKTLLSKVARVWRVCSE